MSGSTLNPPEESRPVMGKGLTTGALGPSDSSDSGSDIRGAVQRPGEVEGELDEHALDGGESALASDTDRNGTGERASADGDGNLTLDGDVLPSGTDDIDDIAETVGGLVAADDEDAGANADDSDGPHAEFDDAAVQDAIAHSEDTSSKSAKP